MNTRTAVVLFNLGGPDGPDAVKPFLFNLFNDRAIISLPQPLRWLLAKIISARRTPLAKEIYAHMGGRSPILELTRQQATALENEINSANGNDEYRVFVSMRYWRPFDSETVREVKKFNPGKIILLPLYPQFSTTTTASSFASWERAAAMVGLDVPSVRVCCYPIDDGFITAEAELVAKSLEHNSIGPEQNFELLFSAHGLPKKIVDKTGDPYPGQVVIGAEAIVKKLHHMGVSNFTWKVSYQSRVGPLEWIGPATDDEIKLAGQRRATLLVVPLAFVSEHSETLVELDIEYAHLAREAGVSAYIRVPAVGTHPAFINGLGQMVTAIAGADAGTTMPAGGQKHCPGASGAKHGACPAGTGG